MKIHIGNGRLIDPASATDRVADLFIAAGRIVSIDEKPEGFHANQEIDASGQIVCPGLVDLSVRLREPGFEYRATLESEMQAAVAGGVTSLACPPDTDPPLDEPGLVEMLKHKAKNLNLAHVYPIGAMTQGLLGADLTEMAELRDAGCMAFCHADKPITNTLVMMRAMQYAATFDLSVWLRAQDASLSRIGVAHEGEVATRLGLPGIPTVAETIALSKILMLARDTGARIHLCRISSSEGLEMVREAKREGLPVTCDVSANHVHLSEMDIGFFDSNCHLVPPLRSLRDRDAIRRALAEGVIDAICSDHTPVDDDAKLLPFGESEAGATGLELLLPLVLKWAEDDRIPLVEALARITSRPAGILGIEAGAIAVGKPADLCIYDPEQYWKVEPKSLKSQGKNTPFLGYEVKGKVICTLVDGHIVHRPH
ncbi:MAG: dihydroorotase [Burkholderiales bacterium]|nr:dihydroorotase [Burkholderiales bacterium]